MLVKAFLAVDDGHAEWPRRPCFAGAGCRSVPVNAGRTRLVEGVQVRRAAWSVTGTGRYRVRRARLASTVWDRNCVRCLGVTV